MQPLLCAFGVSQSQAANCRPDRNNVPSDTTAAIRLAVIGPMLGIVAKRRLTSLARCHSSIPASSRSISSSNRRSWSTRPCGARCASSGIRGVTFRDGIKVTDAVSQHAA
ncbi:hypothetical protein [Azospirillum brasilense]|uniref:hypothetical protein n=1 Tax=Azospirillum brasilense TaxID=192 RepID=UPI00403F3B62